MPCNYLMLVTTWCDSVSGFGGVLEIAVGAWCSQELIEGEGKGAVVALGSAGYCRH